MILLMLLTLALCLVALRQVRHPEKFVGSRDVKWTDAKTEDGRDCVDRSVHEP